MQAAAITVAARRLDGGDAFARGEPGGDDVLDHHDLVARLDAEAAAQLERAALALDVERRHAEMAGGLVAGDDAADGRRDGHVGPPTAATILAARALHSRSQRSARMKTRFFCRKTGLCSPLDSTKWPSRRAPASRNSWRTSSVFMAKPGLCSRRS
jgi:hypothetical protein